MLRRLLLCLVVCVLALGGAATPALASGSADLYPGSALADPPCNGTSPDARCRAAIEWRTNAYGPDTETRIQRRTLFSVFARAGEQILTGSSSVGTGAADITIWNPGQITDTEAPVLPVVVDGQNGFLCSAHRLTTITGLISTRAQELARARSVDGSANTAGYVPCVYKAPKTGLYRVAFYGSAGASGTADGTPDSVLDPGTFRAAAGTAVNAWDLTVRAATDATGSGGIPGRVFTYVLAAFTGGNPRPVTMSMYLNTLDGYRYLVNTNGFDPNGFVFYGNREGFLDADGVTPLNHDVVGVGPAPQQLPALAGGVHLARPQYPLSFEPLAPATLAALGIPRAPVQPVLKAVKFTGRATAHGSYVDQGGTFTLNAGTGGTYEIVISRSDTSSDPKVYDPSRYDPGLPANRVLRGVVGPGVKTIVWDGKDNSGVAFPVRNNYLVKAVLRAGEYHAPMLDVESSTRGGPSITLLNPPNNVCPFADVPSTGKNCTRVFFDDRSYTSSSHVFVGDEDSGLLCPSFVGVLPSSPAADARDGVDSTSLARAFGDGAGKNANAQCSTTNGTLGDSKGLDVWTYFPSQQFETSLDILPVPAEPVAVDDYGTTTVDTPLVVRPVGILGNDAGTRLTVRTPVTSAPTHGRLVLGGDGSYRYTPDPGYLGLDSFTYTITDDAGQTASAIVHLTVTPRAVDDQWTTAVNTPLTVVATGVLTNDVGSPLVASLVSPPTHGSVALRPDGSFDYVPAHDFSGIDTFTYRADSDDLSSPPATVTITVTPTAADDDAGTIPANTVQVVAGPGVLTNDHGTRLTVTSVGTSPAHGTVVIDRDGSYRYTPAPGWSGADSFTYNAHDAAGQPVSARVTVHVAPPPAPPVTAAPVTAPPTLLPPTAVVPATPAPAVPTTDPSLAQTGSEPAGGLALAVAMVALGFALVVARRRLAVVRR
ncbi:Ig-like domain-containing protein [Cellulomonas sp. URHD0024]|uniref:Ig-like domain-containing protein n=1 Tax=Cellulomonas sp. URHD0024 TaxID=1302620 RepID=UPI000421EFAC|nr:Ig-like domain-containing protein [Cellulomonas sp. URHD0024]